MTRRSQADVKVQLTKDGGHPPGWRLFRIMLGKLMPWNATLAFLKTNPKVSVDTLAQARLSAFHPPVTVL